MKIISQTFKKNKKLFIPFITAGDPDLNATEMFVSTLVEAGSDIVELGVPYSDPIGDGPVNIRSSQRALKSKTSLKSILDFVALLRNRGQNVPIVLFTYFNPVLQFGLEKFAETAKKNGVDAVLVVDLPPEEAREYSEILGRNEVGTVFLASPTTSDKRLKLIDQMSTAFVYYVSRAGVTGVQSELSKTLKLELEHVKSIIKKPLAVGFGISQREHVQLVSSIADAVVVGSALVDIIENNLENVQDCRKKISQKVSELAGAL